METIRAALDIAGSGDPCGRYEAEPLTPARMERSMVIFIRLTGLVLLALAWLAGHELNLLSVTIASGQVTISQILCALAAFLCASVGSALVILGPKIHEPVKVSARWRPHS